VNCPKCHTNETRVTSVRRTTRETKRYCRCLRCEHRYITLEMYASAVKKRDTFPLQARRGQDNHFAVLTEDNVRAIRRLAQDTPRLVIAQRYGIHRDTVRRIVTRKLWAHVSDDCA
jgi:transcriptional regulator NrdR family protein